MQSHQPLMRRPPTRNGTPHIHTHVLCVWLKGAGWPVICSESNARNAAWPSLSEGQQRTQFRLVLHNPQHTGRERGRRREECVWFR
mmetsp:Transcript_28845/g.83296  ORF Transcript_28845/g.83296 Transcript_28845/m.83296 type:complete len:86 (-) Transcript_28845:619-876(-)